MRRAALFLVLFSLTTAWVQADSLEKAYFAATSPGTWAKYESRWEMPDGMVGTSIYTYIRASDSADRVRIEVDTETLAGPGEGTVSRQLFILEPGFDPANNLLNHMLFVEASVTQAGDGEAFMMPDSVIEIIRESAGDLTNSVTFKGRVERAGWGCDLYGYTYDTGGPQVTRQEGEICLAEAVPFGVVHQRGRVTDADGNLVSSFEQKLLDSGSGGSGAAALLAMTPDAGQRAAEAASPGTLLSLPLSEAYRSEKIRLFVKVDEGGGGRRLTLVALNKTDEPFDLVVPRGPVTIPAGSPLGVLSLVFEEPQQLSLSPGGSSPPIPAGQSGDRGATGGEFQLTVYEGQPLFQGSVDVGPMN